MKTQTNLFTLGQTFITIGARDSRHPEDIIRSLARRQGRLGRVRRRGQGRESGSYCVGSTHHVGVPRPLQRPVFGSSPKLTAHLQPFYFLASIEPRTGLRPRFPVIRRDFLTVVFRRLNSFLNPKGLASNSAKAHGNPICGWH